MSAPTRIVYTGPNAYALDPYVRDAGGRFATKPMETLAPIRVLESSGRVEVLANGAMTISHDTGTNHWRVRCVREEDGSYRVVYLEEE